MACEAVTGTPDGCHRSAFTRCPTGCSSVAARASSTFGRTQRPRVANTPRTWQRLSCPLLSAAISPTRPDRPRRCLFSAFAVSHRGHAHRLAPGASSAPSTGLRCPSTARNSGRRGWARPPPPRRPSDHPRAAYGMPVWRPRQGCRGILARAFRGRPRRLPRRLARALAGPSPAPSPNPRTVRLSASRPCLRLRRAVVPTCLRALWVARKVYDVDGDAVIA